MKMAYESGEFGSGRDMERLSPEVPCYIHWWRDGRRGWFVYIKEWDAGETGETRQLIEPTK